ncbi:MULTISPECIES: ATP-binding cassette domain-containing protein [unclassified Rothia (in: high G+C Gram-positive bacteria)]|uniref:ATP-binding cassette domain-containing protein n=1 Tax=unclassified Rothia (in: high G+C Gram-positive bacteria) TaxID=2689056 RepID=UPI00195BABE1|nr:MULTISPECIES: ATP-binding cassette domain-containing protein [unclassified Rothia (in: high G+C Gram-positive bacteria)]MBM7050632.1 ATP-binding cassette domain-containing protein [Rothia sp. ZJ1223]QRZ60823.1 ATP-binding cassette domain-containing protein [Rothia sp. ZJ932]
MVEQNISSHQSLVKLADIAVTTLDKERKTLLQVPSLIINAGERVVLTGDSGSGKSLMLSLLAGTTSPALGVTGAITRTYNCCGFIPQRGIEALHPLNKITRQLQQVTGQPKNRVEETLRAVGLDPHHVGRRRPAEISGGQAQRVAIALAVLADAQLIVADEPTSALDHETRDQTLDLLLSVISSQQTLVLTTHDPEVAQRVDGRRIEVHRGVMTSMTAETGGIAA